MRTFKSTKLGAVLALAVAVAMPLMAAAPANAEPVRTERVDGDRGAYMPVHYSHRAEITYRDMHWRDMRFHRHVESWHRGHDERGRFER